MKSPKNLILYKDFENGKLFYNMTWIMENYENEYYNKEDVESLLYESLNQLMELAVSHGFEGNLWHSFLAFILVNNDFLVNVSFMILNFISEILFQLTSSRASIFSLLCNFT